MTGSRFGFVVAMCCVVLAGCGAGQPDGAALFPLPELNATRAGDVVTVKYHLDEHAQPRPRWIVIRVAERGGIPVGGTYRVHGSDGRIQIKVPSDRNDLVALARTLDRQEHSEVAEAPVR